MVHRAGQRKVLDSADWVRAGSDLLAAKGVQAVRVESLAKHLRISKGSFYWHFRDREDLLEAILEAWEFEQKAWNPQPSDAYASPAENWAKFVEFISQQERARLDVAVFSWAREEERVSRRVAEIERQKIAYLTRVFRQIGFSSAQSEELAQAVMLLYLGWLDRATRDASFRESGPSLAELLSQFVLAASALSAQDALRP